MKTIDIIPWHATNGSTCPVDGDTMVTVWCKNKFLYRDRAEEFDWTSARENPIIAYAVTPDEFFQRERWRATDEGRYYYIDSSGRITFSYELSREFDDLQRHTFGNYFRTEEQCAEAARRAKATFLAYHEELMRGEG